MRPNRCYSCMSPLYEELFKDGIMSRYFYEPRNFTSQCNEPMQPFNIGLVNCKSICLTLTQDFVVMGKTQHRQKVNNTWLCGLYKSSRLFNRTMVLFNKYDMCRDVKASDFFRYESDSQIVRVCSCLGDRCNISASYCVATPQFVVAAAIFYLLSRNCFRSRANKEVIKLKFSLK
ncbi:Protein CBR-HOT-3 [Dirofilaria immitis]|nr:Protein CBR-HOT-3 [Dirofilaria immitis]